MPNRTERWTHADILADLRIVLRPGTALSMASRRKFVDVLLWKFAEVGGKHEQPYASTEAHVLRKAGERGWKSLVRLDHAVPRALLGHALLQAKGFSESDLARTMGELCLGVLVTIGEHASLTANDGPLRGTVPIDIAHLLRLGPWARYRDAGVHILDTRTGRPAWAPHTRRAVSPAKSGRTVPS